MPVTAKLSRRFYEQFGDELTNEFVAWFNAVDATYRSDLRDTNAANFTRFDARLKQRVAEVEAKIDQRYRELDSKIDQRYLQLDAKIDHRTAELSQSLTATIAASESRMLRWMLTLWMTSMVGIAGLLIAVLRSR